MSTSLNPSRPPIPARPREPLAQRPLPKGIVPLAQAQNPQPESSAESAPEGALIVGRDIQVKGQIEDCRVLIVEGRVEASVKAQRLEIRKGGLFLGRAEVEQAEIAGTFDGNLNAAQELKICDSGRVQGEIRYTRIVIDGGGEIAGTVGTVAEAEKEAAAAQTPSLADTGT